MAGWAFSNHLVGISSLKERTETQEGKINTWRSELSRTWESRPQTLSRSHYAVLLQSPGKEMEQCCRRF